MSFETNLKRIDWRNWNDIKEKWLSYLPIIEPPGKAPEIQISELTDLYFIIKELKTTGEYRTEFTPLREAVFREAIFLFYKSISVSSCSELNISNGFITWSVSNSYHSSFFCIKSILGLLGITLPRISELDILIDIYPEPEQLSKNKLKKGIKPEPTMKYLKFGSLNHYHIWQIFQRTINVLNIEIWDKKLVGFLTSTKSLSFAKQRNSIHYNNNFWIYNDLLDPLSNQDVFSYSHIFNDIEKESFSARKDFSIFISFILIGFAYALLKDLAQDTPIIKDEIELINKTIDNSFHLGYKKFFDLNFRNH